MSIASVNMDRLVDESNRGKAFTKKLIEVTQQFQLEASDLEKRLRHITDKLSNRDTKVTEAMLFDLSKEQQLINLQLKHLRERGETELSLQAQRYKEQVVREVTPVIHAYAKEKNLTMVVSIPEIQACYIKPDIDITEEILKRFNTTARVESK